ADNGAPELSTVRLLVLTETMVPESEALRVPPINKLSAPKPVSPAALSTNSPGDPLTFGPAIKMSTGLLISTKPPRPPVGAADSRLPWIDIADAALNKT